MMARITMNRDSADLGQDSDNGEETAGVSSLIFLGGLSKEENIFPVLMSWLSSWASTVVWWSCVFLGKHWVSETVKTNT